MGMQDTTGIPRRKEKTFEFQNFLQWAVSCPRTTSTPASLKAGSSPDTIMEVCMTHTKVSIGTILGVYIRTNLTPQWVCNSHIVCAALTVCDTTKGEYIDSMMTA